MIANNFSVGSAGERKGEEHTARDLTSPILRSWTRIGAFGRSRGVSTAETQVDTQAPDGGEVVGVPSIGDAIGGLAAAFGQGRTVTREAAKLGG